MDQQPEVFEVWKSHYAALELAVTGLTDKQIGDRLGLTHKTVQSYLETIRGICGSRNRRELMLLFNEGRFKVAPNANVKRAKERAIRKYFKANYE